MANDLQATLTRLNNKCSIILERYRRLEQQLQQQRNHGDMLEKQVEAQRAQIERLQLENEYLRLATTVAPSREQVEETKATIRNMVREIDRCINDLTD